MRQTHNTDLRKTYDQIAEDWHKDHLDDAWWKPVTERFASLLSPGSSILDVGCAGGIVGKFFAERGFRVTGIDFSENMIAIAKREVQTGTFVVADLYKLDEFPGQFNAVFAKAVLLHIPQKDIPEIMGKLVRKLRLGGYLYLAVKERDEGQLEEDVKKEHDYGYTYERFFSYFTLPEMQHFVEQAGLQIVFSDVTQSGNVRWIQCIGRNGGRDD